MKIKQTILLLVLSIGMIGIFIVPVASAAKCGGVDTNILGCDNPGGAGGTVDTTGIWGVLLLAINILTAGVGVAAIGGIVVGSILYTTAGGKPEQIKKANTVLINTLFGIIIYALAYSFLNFIIPGGIL
jgi:hypothetical protein